MADVVPNYKIEQYRLQMQIMEQDTALAKTRLEAMEMVDRIDKNNVNLKSTSTAIANIEKDQESAKTALEKQRRKSQVAGLVANVERQTLENLELQDRIVQMVDREKAELTAKDNFSKQLASLNTAHGEPPTDTVESIAKKLGLK